MPRLAILGGTGIYRINGLNVLEEITLETPFGPPSAAVIRATLGSTELLFLPRHGTHHQFLPHEVNYRANIFALKKLGARQVISLSAVGSLREEIHPGEMVIPTQYFDFVKGTRSRTFFGEGLAAHISTAEPVCKNLATWITGKAKELGLSIETGKTYGCVDGPRLGTKAESQFLRMVGCDLVGMTNVPEVFLAREAQLCYITIGIVTDYDCWMDNPDYHVTVAKVIERYQESLKTAETLLKTLLASEIPQEDLLCRRSLESAVLTPEEAIPRDKRELLSVLRT